MIKDILFFFAFNNYSFVGGINGFGKVCFIKMPGWYPRHAFIGDLRCRLSGANGRVQSQLLAADLEYLCVQPEEFKIIYENQL